MTEHPDTPAPPSPEPHADRIRRLRRAMGWTQGRMAEHLGVGQSTVAGYETGFTVPGPVLRLLDILEARIAAEASPSPEQGSAA